MGSRVIQDENFGFCIRLRGNLKLSNDSKIIVNLAKNDVDAIFKNKPLFNSRVEGYHELLKLMNEKYDINYSEFIKNNKHIWTVSRIVSDYTYIREVKPIGM